MNIASMRAGRVERFVQRERRRTVLHHRASCRERPRPIAASTSDAPNQEPQSTHLDQYEDHRFPEEVPVILRVHHHHSAHGRSRDRGEQGIHDRRSLALSVVQGIASRMLPTSTRGTRPQTAWRDAACRNFDPVWLGQVDHLGGAIGPDRGTGVGCASTFGHLIPGLAYPIRIVDFREAVATGAGVAARRRRR